MTTSEMMKRVVKKTGLHDRSSKQDDLRYWLSKTPQERIEAVELLWAIRHGNSKRLQKVVRVFR